ncbi:hypothetical protein Asulf_00149 [Archaeoglobus sulfaticallidus PM70-1]|uniref:Major facilitator superfamily (MFS) profile domain-containing protein n=1 Tax=Archaeoglobus sulfaticallidus PM70-1 TaxID=387631 RepID=N0B992_9EURY|nr:hypothetical protein [Archaeoglobus sulfaticallidus]AGK60184.1 hypothetical protein Asulf_00149 [Archaeoglobus sulfaticallidus PM70-1]
MSIELLALLLGMIYGYINPGREDRINILKKAVIFGIVVGIILGLLVGIIFPPAGILVAGAGMVGFTIITLYFAVFFVVGTIIGDFLERKK